jgi:hypothetical protein
VYGATRAFSALYQFWIHTQLIGKIGGPLGSVLNLPEHHRVHHAVNPSYLDKNFGATLIVWDRLFGTYAEEREPCVYGTVKPLRSFNVAWAQAHFWVELWQRAQQEPNFADKLRVWWASPSSMEGGRADGAEAAVHARAKYSPPLTRGMTRYVALQMAGVVIAATALIYHAKRLPFGMTAAAITVLSLALLSIGGLMERKAWAVPLEIGRLIASLILLVLIGLSGAI